MNKTLNDTQRKLVEDNHNLIYSFLRSRNLSLDAVEDWYGTAAIGLCKAALVFDESRGCKFTTLAYMIMDNEVRMIMRQNRKNVSASVSLNSPINTADGCCLADIIPDTKDFMYSIYLNDAVSIASRGLSDRDKKIVRLILEEGYSQRKVSKLFGVSQAQVSRIYRGFYTKIKEYFEG